MKTCGPRETRGSSGSTGRCPRTSPPPAVRLPQAAAAGCPLATAAARLQDPLSASRASARYPAAVSAAVPAPRSSQGLQGKGHCWRKVAVLFHLTIIRTAAAAAPRSSQGLQAKGHRWRKVPVLFHLMYAVSADVPSQFFFLWLIYLIVTRMPGELSAHHFFNFFYSVYFNACTTLE